MSEKMFLKLHKTTLDPDERINNNYINGGSSSDIAFSRKALHQCDADENLFLRFLELDSPAKPASDTQSNQSPTRRASITKPPSPGKTPFTITKTLQRSTDKTFGFSVVWTHPIKIEKVDQGSSADKSGILPGDYIIFIDKYNIVTMPEQDILNLIRTQGDLLILEIFRRPTKLGKMISNSKNTTGNNNQHTYGDDVSIKPLIPLWSSSAYSNTSLETTKRRMQLPQVANSKESIAQQTPDSLRRRYLIQLINREQHFISAINFGIERFVLPSANKDKKELISINDHRTLFQNIDELLQISEDIIEQLLQNDHDPQIHFASRVYLSKTTAVCAAYKKYCNGLKRADCVLVNKSRTSNSDFMNFINDPPIPKKRPDITTFIHRPLQHFREILKLIQMIATSCPNESEENKNFTNVINELQAAYREITVSSGLMEPVGEGRPLLTLQDLESRLVFTKCKPFTLKIPGRQWIFGGDLSRIDGRSVKQYWTLLFSDILLFAKVSRDRVLFITDEPLPLSNVVDCCFNIRKKNTEFRLTIDPNGRTIESPTVNCAPDLSRTPMKSAKRRTLILRAASSELKAVWQNLLTRQIFIVNSTLGSSLNSPLESPDVFNLQQFGGGDINAITRSMATIKLSSIESINNQKNQQMQNQKLSTNGNTSKSCAPAKINKHLEALIDEKCHLLSKSGVSKEGTVHLAHWMKGQFNKQVCASDPIESDEEENSQLHDWSVEEVRKRSTELNLTDDSSKKHDDTLNLSELDDDLKSASRSTTSDSQITVRSSPINNNNSRSDSISVCRQCHKFCKKKFSKNLSPHDSNNNQVKKLSCSSSSTIVEDVKGSERGQLIEETLNRNSQTNSARDRYFRTSKTMTAFSTSTKPDSTPPTPLKTSTSSPASFQKPATPPEPPISSKMARVNFFEAMSSPINQQNHNNSPSLSSICKCECKPKDFAKPNLSPDELKHEIVKILNDVDEISSKKSSTNSSYSNYSNNTVNGSITNGGRFSSINSNHINTANNNCNHVNMIKETMISSRCDNETSSETKKDPISNGVCKNDSDDLSLMLIDLAQFHPTTSLVHISPSLPTISVVPPTPEPMANKHQSIFTKDLEITKVNSISIKHESFDSPDGSPEEEEPPYMALKTGLRRFGTMSSLERFPSEDTDEKTVNSSEEDSEPDLKIITREVYDQTQTFRTWTSRAGSFLEESRAFIDKYLGRQENGYMDDAHADTRGIKEAANDYEEYDTIEGETSGATSGEEVWGTPTSGGENDEIHMFNNADGNKSSPTKSSSSGDEDTEIMMDELLMAPPMTSSNIRGLLPRRRLEPLFEEDTDSCDSNNESCLLNSDKQGHGKSIERCPSLPTSTDSDSPKTTPSSPRTSLMDMELELQPMVRTFALDLPLKSASDESAEEETLKTSILSNPARSSGPAADKCGASAQTTRTVKSESPSPIDLSVDQPDAAQLHQLRLSPRLEMRLALNHDIMGDEDLINYEGPSLTSILGRDLSSYHRITGKDIIMNRIMNRKDVINNTHCSNKHLEEQEGNKSDLKFSSQQNNSKMDTPILNRKANQLTWNNSGFARKEEKALSDLERLARREKIYCMSQHQNSDNESTKSDSAHTKSKLLRFLSVRRNSESQKLFHKETMSNCSNDDSASFISEAGSHRESDKSLDRRFWKQLTKRGAKRRSSSVSST